MFVSGMGSDSVRYRPTRKINKPIIHMYVKLYVH